MAIPTFLSGAAGRALTTLKPLETMATHVDDVLARAPRMVAGDVVLQVEGSSKWLPKALARDTINAAKGDLLPALGSTRQPAFSAELHAAAQNLDGGMAAIGRLNGRAGVSDDAISSMSRNTSIVHAGVQELEAAARATATKRGVVIGSLAIGGALAGLIALRGAGGGSDSIPMAPGPIGEQYQPAERGTMV